VLRNVRLEGNMEKVKLFHDKEATEKMIVLSVDNKLKINEKEC
jgi:hypothetical protein